MEVSWFRKYRALLAGSLRPRSCYFTYTRLYVIHAILATRYQSAILRVIIAVLPVPKMITPSTPFYS